jgi:hypothetical protein
LFVRLFPHVPVWWVVGRLIALLVGATLVAAAVRHLATQPNGIAAWSPQTEWRYWWVPTLALLSAGAHLACLPWRSVLPPAWQALFVLWFGVPAALLAWGVAAPPQTAQRYRCDRWNACGPVAGVIAFWLVCRIIVSWHSPRAADVVDTWRPFGGFVHLVSTHGNFLTDSMDPDLPGLSSILLFFQGFSFFQLSAHLPGLASMQAANAVWLALGAAATAAIAGAIIGREVAAFAAVTFLFSPFILVLQLTPTPSFLLLVPGVLGLLLLHFDRTGSPAALALLGPAAGIAAGMPMLVPILGLTLLLVARRVWKGPRIPVLVVLTALLSLVTALAANLPSPSAMRAMVGQYASSQIPLAVAEEAVNGQLAPTLEDWLGGPLPEGVPLQQILQRGLPVDRGWLLVPAGALLSPFAIPRWPLRQWGDTLFEPFSAALAAVGLLVCLRFARRDSASLCLLLFLAAALGPAFISSYDRASIFRQLGAPIPVALVATVGFASALSLMTSAVLRRRVILVMSIAVAFNGMLIFDVINPRILGASSLGLMVRSVEEDALDRVALLTSYGRDSRSDVAPGKKHWELDWLRKHHPYIAEIIRCVPEQPIPMVEVEHLVVARDRTADQDVVFWSPALEETASVRTRICAVWSDATVYTITDASGLSRVFAAHLGGSDWKPAVPRRQWTSERCGKVAT